MFLIYIRPLFETTTSFSVSYMDDISISVSSTSLRKNIRLLERQVASLFTQGTPCAIQFDAAKTELIHFTTGQTAPTATLTLPGQTVVIPKEVVRWLGIHFDSALSFKDHVAIRTSQAKSAFFRMCRLANTERGLSPFAMRQLYMACVTSIADYGCQVHWKGQGSTLKLLQGLQNLALRKILGTFRSSPIIPSEVEAALLPPEVRLNTAIRQYAFRARKLPANHPVKEDIHHIQTALFSNSDSDTASEDSELEEYAYKIQQGPSIQLERIIQSIQSTLSTPEEQLISHCFRPWEKHTAF